MSCLDAMVFWNVNTLRRASKVSVENHSSELSVENLLAFISELLRLHLRNNHEGIEFHVHSETAQEIFLSLMAQYEVSIAFCLIIGEVYLKCRLAGVGLRSVAGETYPILPFDEVKLR